MMIVSFPDQQWLDEVGPVDGVQPVVWDPADEPPNEDVEAFIAPYMAAPQAFDALTAKSSVRLVQLLSAGFDGVPERLADGVAVANAKGVHDAATAEQTMALVLASQRGFPDFHAGQVAEQWRQGGFRPGLADHRVLLLGYGSVGRAIAQRLAPFEVSLTAVASRARAGDDLVETVHGIDELPQLLPEHDIVISVLPSSDATTGILDRSVLSALTDDALVVNVGRGSALDTDAALEHAGRLRFALDVTDPEPLPDGHPLWSAPGVLISPHVGGRTAAFRPRAIAMLRRQLKALVAGDEPINLVHRG